MAVRDIFSNTLVNGHMADATGTSGLNGTFEGSLPVDMSLGTTSYLVGTISIELASGNFNSISITFGDADNDGSNYTADPLVTEVFDDTTNVSGKSPLGNTLIDLETGLPIVFPRPVTITSGVQFALAINNPAGTYQWANYEVVGTASTAQLGVCSMIGPLRYVDQTKVIGA